MAKKGRQATRREPRNGTVYTLIVPNPNFDVMTQGDKALYMDGKVRFIEGKAKITDALARTCAYKDGVTTEIVPFENAEELARHLMDTVGNNDDPRLAWRCVPALPVREPVADEYNPNVGKSRRERLRSRRTMQEAIPAGVPAGADPDIVFAGPRKQKEAVASGR